MSREPWEERAESPIFTRQGREQLAKIYCDTHMQAFFFCAADAMPRNFCVLGHVFISTEGEKRESAGREDLNPSPVPKTPNNTALFSRAMRSIVFLSNGQMSIR